ncbi:MAG: fibronectin type III domain-containing protein [Treponema sp.]|nr:fibronectin type III domain-containing protein [Treponema sp.]
MKKIVIILLLAIAGCNQPYDDPGKKPDSVIPMILNLEVIPSDQQLTLKWDDISEAIYQVLVSDGKTEQLFEVQLPVKVVQNLSNGVEYACKVRVKINGTFGNWSETKYGTPFHSELPPTAPSAKVKAYDQSLNISWAPVAGAVEYDVTLDGILVAETNNPNCVIQGLTNGKEYEVVVSARNSQGSTSGSPIIRKPDRYIKLYVIGMGINLFGSLDALSLALRPILNIDSLNEDDAYVAQNESSSNWRVFTGETIKEIICSMNISQGMSADLPFKGIVFGGNISSAYSKNYNSQTRSEYGMVEAQHSILNVVLRPTLYEIRELQKYFTEGFLYAMEHESPRELFSHYGHGLIVGYRLGGRRRFYVTHFSSKEQSFNDFRSGFNAHVNGLGNIFGVSVETEQSGSSSSSSWISESEITFEGSAGSLSRVLSFEDALLEYPFWVDSIPDNPGIAGIDYLNNVIPLWDIAKMLGLKALAQDLKDEFIRQATVRVAEYESIFPCEWFTYGETVYGPGTAVFNQPVQYIVDEDGNKFPAMVKYIFYIGAGGAGGRGGSEWGTNGVLDGGAGAGGAMIKLVFSTDKGILAYITVGKGGSPGIYQYGHAWDNPGVSSGGASTVTVYDHTFTAFGGNFSPYTNYNYYPAPGGTGSPLIPPDFIEEYIIADGEQTYGIRAKPGAGGKIDGHSAGAGGNGGSRRNGDPGEDGSVRIQYSYYDGQ